MKTVFHFLILLFFIITSSGIIAQNRTTDTSATCIAFWKNKESKIYQIKHSKEKTESATKNSKSESGYEAHIKIIDSSEAGFTIEWVYKNFTNSGAPEYTLNSLNAIMDGLKFVYKTNDVGTFSELLNWQEVRDYSIKSYEKAIADKSKNKDFVAAISQLKTIFNSKENIEMVLIKEIQLFHSPYGVEYNISGLSVETELPNVTGGQAIPATISIKLNELKVNDDFCKVSINQKIDKGKAGPIIIDMLKKLSGKPNQNEEEIKKGIIDMEVSDYNDFTYNISSGWLSKILFKRFTHVGIFKQVEIYEISIK